MEWVNIVAIVLSPIIAVLITIWIQSRKEKLSPKLWVFGTLMSNRHSPIADEPVKALNMIDVVFHDCVEVRDLWHQYFGMLSNDGLNNPNGFKQRQAKNLEMLAAMAKAAGYGKTITHLDVDRVYYPKGLGTLTERSEAIANELLRVLKASGGLQVNPKIEGDGKAA